MAKVFVSYSRKDIVFAKRLTAELQKCELDFWIDWEGIPPTVDWWREIEKGIEEADVFLFFISPDSAKSKVCGQEIETAVKNGKRIIPIVVRDIAWEDTPKHLGHLNYIFIRESDDFDAAANKLITAIQTDYEWAATHRRLQVKALDWERNNKETGFLLRGMDLLDAEQDLAANTSKDPHPTDLQREYVFESRKATDRQRRIISWAAIAAAVALATLAAFGFYQANVATKQAQIALARQLAAQAQFVNTASSKQMVATLINIQSMKVFPIKEAATFLINNNHAAFPISHFHHDSPVYSVAFSPDGKYVVSGSKDRTALVWEASSGKEVVRMTHKVEVRSAVFSPDGRYIVSGGTDGIAHVWEVASGKEIAHMSHDSTVESIAFSPDGRYVVSGGCDEALDNGVCERGSARVWESMNGKEVARMTLEGLVASVAFSPDSRYVVSGSCDSSDPLIGFCLKGSARVWESMNGKEVARMTHESLVSSVVFSPDGNYVASGSWDNTARVWEAINGHEIARMTHDGPVESVAFSPDGFYVVSGGGDVTAHVWAADTGKEVARMNHDRFVRSAVFSPDGKHVASWAADGTVRVWEYYNGKEVARMTHDVGVSSAVFSPDGRHVVSGSTDGTARVWEAIREIGANSTGYPAVFSPRGKYVASVSEGDEARIWETATGKDVTGNIHKNGINSIAFSTDEKYVVLASCEEWDTNGACKKGFADVWDVASRKEIARMLHDGLVSHVAFSPDGKYVVSVVCDESDTYGFECKENSAHLWDTASGEEIARINPEGLLKSIVFSPDSKYVISTGDDDTARLWETAAGHEISHMTHRGLVNVFTFDPDGKYMASAGCDEANSDASDCKESSVRVWEVINGEEVARLTQHGEIISIAFSPDGEYGVSVSCDERGANRSCLKTFVPIWETRNGKEVARIMYDGSVNSVAFSPDRKHVISGGCDERDINGDCMKGSVHLWEATSGEKVFRMLNDKEVTSVAFSPDGKYVVSGGWWDAARIWEVATGKEIARATTQQGFSSVAFSPDPHGRYLVITDTASVRVVAWQPEDLIAGACAVMTRNLTRAEWDQFIGDALQYPSKREDAACPELPIDTLGSNASTP